MSSKIRLLQWKQFKADNNLTYNKMSRILFPFGLDLPRERAKSRKVYQVEDEANVIQD